MKLDTTFFQRHCSARERGETTKRGRGEAFDHDERHSISILHRRKSRRKTTRCFRLQDGGMVVLRPPKNKKKASVPTTKKGIDPLLLLKRHPIAQCLSPYPVIPSMGGAWRNAIAVLSLHTHFQLFSHTSWSFSHYPQVFFLFIGNHVVQRIHPS